MTRGISWLIDRSGASWPHDAHPIARWTADCDPMGYAVADLGFIHLRQLSGGLTVRFNPSRLARTTMISAFYVIASEQPSRIALSYGDKCPDLEIFGSVAKAIRRIEELVEIHPPAIPAIAHRRRSLDHPPTPFAKQITELLSFWNNASAQWAPERHANLSGVVPLKDTMVVRRPRGTDRVVNDYWGAHCDFLGLRWPRIARGKNVEEHPLRGVGKRLASQYRLALGNTEPCVYDVDLALLTKGATTFHRRYTRLVLPWHEPGGDSFATTIRFDEDAPAT